MFVCIFFTFIWWISLFRRVYAMKEIPLTFTTYCVSSLKHIKVGISIKTVLEKIHNK
jgi:hypothetical protein